MDLKVVTRGQVTHWLRPESQSTYSTSSLALSLALFLFLFSFYLLTYTPRINSSDGLAVFATAESLARRGEWDADQIRWMGLQQGIFGPDGHLYVRKGIGQSLLALPLVWLGMLVPMWGAATTALLFNALVTAATGALLLHYLRALGYDSWIALAGGLTFGLATLAWPYAKTFFSEPLAALCLLGAALALLRFRQSGHAMYALGAGLALAVAVGARYANAVMIPLFGLLLLCYQIGKHLPHRRCGSANRQGESGDQPLAPSPPPSAASDATIQPRPASLPAIQPSNLPALSPQSLISTLYSLNWRAWFAFAAPLALAALALAYHNLARYGDALNTGYLPEENFGGDWWQGLAGLLVSPGRGIFLYAPLLLLALPAAPAFVRRHRAEGALAIAIILAHLLLYGKWFMWHGGYAWGPRFLVPTLPFFMILMAPAIQWARQPGWPRRSFLALAAASGLIQVLGLSVHFELFQNRLLDTGLPLFAPVTFFDPRYSPLAGQFQFLRPEYLDFAWITGGQVNWPLLAVLVAAVLATGWNLVRVGWLDGWMAGWLEDQRTRRPVEAPSSNHPTIQPSNHPTIQPSILPILLLLAVAAWLLAYAHTQYPGDLRELSGALNASTTADDAVVTGTPDESAAFADVYRGRADVLGLNASDPLDAATAAALAETARRHPRVWWLPNWLPAEENGLERWLMTNGFRAENRTAGQRRLALYYFPAHPLTETELGASLGGDVILDRAAMLPSAQAGDVLPLVLLSITHIVSSQ